MHDGDVYFFFIFVDSDIFMYFFPYFCFIFGLMLRNCSKDWRVFLLILLSSAIF